MRHAKEKHSKHIHDDEEGYSGDSSESFDSEDFDHICDVGESHFKEIKGMLGSFHSKQDKFI